MPNLNKTIKHHLAYLKQEIQISKKMKNRTTYAIIKLLSIKN